MKITTENKPGKTIVTIDPNNNDPDAGVHDVEIIFIPDKACDNGRIMKIFTNYYGLFIAIDGYTCATQKSAPGMSMTSENAVVFIDAFFEEARVLVWDDINNEEPNTLIDLAAAKDNS